MAVFRINKSKDFVTMSKYHFKEKGMSLKAKGLLSEMLSLPEEWDYSVTGLTQINLESRNCINSILNELEEFGYLKRTRNYVNGRIDSWTYDIYERPLHLQNEDIENVDIEILDIENDTQLNNKELNNKELNNKELNNKQYKENNKKKKYGEYKNVLLTEKEYERLKEDFGNVDELIKYLDEYIEEKGYKSKSHNLSIRRWVVKAVKEKRKEAKQFDRPSWLDMDL